MVPNHLDTSRGLQLAPLKTHSNAHDLEYLDSTLSVGKKVNLVAEESLTKTDQVYIVSIHM
jgi:hypothetical protein